MMRKVRASLVLTVNLGNYESIKFDCGLEGEFEASEWEEQFKKLSLECIKGIRTQIKYFKAVKEKGFLDYGSL